MTARLSVDCSVFFEKMKDITISTLFLESSTIACNQKR